MIVVHTAFHNDALLLWAEQSASTSNGKKGTYPFAASGAALRDSVERLGLPPARQSIVTMQGWLPTHRGKPLASSRLVDEELRTDVTSRLEQWHIPALSLDFASFGQLFSNALDSGPIVPGVAPGDDLRYWQAAYSFACGLVVRQRFLPGVRQVRSGIEAVWEPVIAGEDMTTFTALAQALPGACRAFAGADAISISRMQLLHRFILFAVDKLVRAAAADAIPYVVATSTGHDRWLRALMAENARIEATYDEARSLQSDIGRWKRPINATLAAPFRLVFRLEEPALEPAEVDLEISQHPARFQTTFLP